ncbi:MAG: AbrB/MazE/SpoVT family DNA-binding domain-containing protein [Synergistaceae bacterium]|nr:AbrB/MazE/SpoVT family DNA-binding domain-containing protein [Synergistaceae bacterium]
MSMAKIYDDGKITLPVEIRRLLGLKLGDKVTFLQNQNGEVVLINSSAQAIHKAQEAFSGAAEVLGVKDDDDVQALISELRRGKN